MLIENNLRPLNTVNGIQTHPYNIIFWVLNIHNAKLFLLHLKIFTCKQF